MGGIADIAAIAVIADIGLCPWQLFEETLPSIQVFGAR
jgi:hypothetical protein